MTIDRTPVTVLLLLVLLAASQFLVFYPKLPDTLAVHFGVGGQPDSWSAKGTFVATYAGIEAIFVVLALGSVFLIRKVPPSMFSLPNKDYWFAPERKEQALDNLATRVAWFEIVTLAFLIAIAQIIFNANLGGAAPALSNDFWIVFVGFIAVIGWLSVRLWRSFGRPAEE